MGLGDSFPPAERRESFKRQFSPGRIVRLHCSFTVPPKDKFLLLVCINPKPLFFVINSGINSFIQIKKQLLDAQIQIKGSDYNCLSHDSYLDCSKVIGCIDIEEIEEQIVQNPSRLKETINDETVSKILTVVTASRLIELKYKKSILESLKELSASSDVEDDSEVPF